MLAQTASERERDIERQSRQHIVCVFVSTFEFYLNEYMNVSFTQWGGLICVSSGLTCPRDGSTAPIRLVAAVHLIPHHLFIFR